MNVFERIRRQRFDMSMREMTYLLRVAPATYRKLEKGDVFDIRAHRDITQYADDFEECVDLPDIHLVEVSDDIVSVCIGEATFDIKKSDLYDYFVFRPLVLRHGKFLLPRMKHTIWREQHLPALLARMEK